MKRIILSIGVLATVSCMNGVSADTESDATHEQFTSSEFCSIGEREVGKSLDSIEIEGVLLNESGFLTHPDCLETKVFLQSRQSDIKNEGEFNQKVRWAMFTTDAALKIKAIGSLYWIEGFNAPYFDADEFLSVKLVPTPIAYNKDGDLFKIDQSAEHLPSLCEIGVGSGAVEGRLIEIDVLHLPAVSNVFDINCPSESIALSDPDIAAVNQREFEQKAGWIFGNGYAALHMKLIGELSSLGPDLVPTLTVREFKEVEIVDAPAVEYKDGVWVPRSGG